MNKIADNVIATEGGYYYMKDDHSVWKIDIDFPHVNVTNSRITDNAKTIAAGLSHLLVLRNDSTLWGTGSNGKGQLGFAGNYLPSCPLFQITDKVAGISAGRFSSFYIKGDNSLWFTGESNTQNVSKFTRIAWNVKAVAAGAVNTIIKMTDNTYWTIGQNWYGQIGDGTNIDKSTFFKINF